MHAFDVDVGTPALQFPAVTHFPSPAAPVHVVTPLAAAQATAAGAG